ncbi:MAG: M56 family metallopeptidase [Solirubrobacterales bacterium]|nr:M56 family metallopeptidase [Solirubrobacterales bacterium]
MRHREKIATASAPGTTGQSDLRLARPAAIAAARVSRAGLLLGLFGLTSSLFVVVRLVEAWHVTPQASSRRISLLGFRLSYPTANLAAVVVLVLAVLGLAVTVMTVVGAARELLASRRFGRRIGASDPGRLEGALVFDDARPRAFCAGLLRPRVYISTGAVRMLDELSLSAVLLHEREHARRHDPLRLATGRVLARTLFFVPGLDELVRRQQALAELSADESAVNAAQGNRSALARAMLTFSDGSERPELVGLDPQRVDYLLGEPPAWRFPALISLAALSVLVLITAVAVLAGQLASGSATLAPPFLSSQPCVFILAMIPAVMGLGALYVVRRRERRPPATSWSTD